MIAGQACASCIEEYNLHRKEDGYEPIRVGFGVNTGTILLGTIGDKERMEGTGRRETMCQIHYS